MAWRLDEAVEHGMIDNTVEGLTTGKIWLVGRDEPLILSLNGDCWRDLAGTVLEFENPNPQADREIEGLDTEQTGIIGDITASRKARVPNVDETEMAELERQHREVPFQWRNVLYIEWFSEVNGRVLIETVGYELRVSDHVWTMDEDMEEAQKLANLSAMRDFLAQVICRSETDESDESASVSSTVRGELNEYEWEERLKESDRLSDAYQEVLEKYMEDADCERKEAFVMGWDGLLGAMAERDEEGEDDDFDEDEDDDVEESWKTGGFNDEDGDFEDEEDHPLQIKAQELALRSCDLVNRDGDGNSAAERMISNLIQVSSKLAGVLHGHDTGYEPEAGFVLAVLKRCLNFINEAVGANAELIAAEKDMDQIAALEHLRSDIFVIRDGILELRRELKES